MKSFNRQDPIDGPYKIEEGYIKLSPEIESVTGYSNPIKITEVGDLQQQLKVDEHGILAVTQGQDMPENIDEIAVERFQVEIDTRREILGLIISDLVGIPVDRLSEHAESVDTFCSDYVYQN